MKRTFILILSIASCVLSVDLQAQNSDIYLSNKEDSVKVKLSTRDYLNLLMIYIFF